LVIVRRLRASEIDFVQQEFPASSRHVDGVLRTYHETRLIAQQGGLADYLIAWADGTPVGHVFLRWGADEPFIPEARRSDPLAEALAVRTDMQSRGIGTAIMREAERLARQRGFTVLGLAVGTENVRARRLYAGLGYRESGHGEFEITWPAIDAQGTDLIRSERCTYLVKALA
jgi:GNAT superfamily N-acetyltransferase